MLRMTVGDLPARLAQEVALSTVQAVTAGTRRDRKFHEGRASGLRLALELADIARRSEDAGGPVEVRNSEDIMKEMTS